MLLVDNAITDDVSNPFDGLQPETIQRQVNGSIRFKKARLEGVLASKDSKRLRLFIKEHYPEEQQCDMEKEIQDQLPDFNCEEHDFVYSCSELFYSLVRQYIDNKSNIPSKSRKKVQSSTPDGIIDAFEKTYKKEISLPNVLSGIRSEIWKEIDAIINTCKSFKRKTEELNRAITILNNARVENDQAKFDSNYPTYDKLRDENESLFNEIFRKWGHLYKTYANIIEIREITRIDFAHSVLTPPENKLIHIAGDNTDNFIEKLRQLSEDYLFT